MRAARWISFAFWARLSLGGILLLAGGCASWRPSASRSPAAAPRLTDAQIERRADAYAGFAAGTVHDLRADPAQAMADYRKALEADPGNEALAVELARRHIEAQQPAEALQVLDLTVRTGRATGLAHAWRGIVLEQAGQPEAAMAAFREATRRSPRLFLGHLGQARLRFQQKDGRAALAVLDRAAARTDVEAPFLIELADTLAMGVREQVLTEAEVTPRLKRVLDRAWEAGVTDPEALRRVGELYRAGGFVEEAVRSLERLLGHESVTNPALRSLLHEQLFQLYVQLERPDEAKRQLEAILANNPTNPQTYLILAHLASSQRQFAEAADYLRRLLVLQPGFEPAYYELAAMELSLREPAAALATLGRARDRFKPNFILEFYTAVAHVAREDYPAALRHLGSAEVLAKVDAPERLDGRFYFQLGATLERLKHYDEAEGHFRRSLELDPDNANTLNYLGYMWADLGIHLEEALELIERAVELEPDNPAYIDSLAWVLYRLGRFEEALPHQLRAVELQTEPDSTLLDHLGDIYAALGMMAEARQAWQEALPIEKDETVQTRIREKLGDLGPPE